MAEVKGTQKSADNVQAKLNELQERENLIDLRTGKYDTAPEWQLPEPTRLMTTNAYKTKIVEPFTRKLKGVIGSIVAQYLELRSTVDGLRSRLSREIASNERLMDRITEERQANTKLSEVAKDYKRVRRVLGEEQTDNIIEQAKAAEQEHKRLAKLRGRDRNR